MLSQLQKLVVICNACFWFSVLARYFKKAALLPQDLLSTIVVLAIMALLVNIAAFSGLLIARKNNTVQKWQPVWTVFNVLSFFAQLVYFYFFLT